MYHSDLRVCGRSSVRRGCRGATVDVDESFGGNLICLLRQDSLLVFKGFLRRQLNKAGRAKRREGGGERAGSEWDRVGSRRNEFIESIETRVCRHIFLFAPTFNESRVTSHDSRHMTYR